MPTAAKQVPESDNDHQIVGAGAADTDDDQSGGFDAAFQQLSSDDDGAAAEDKAEGEGDGGQAVGEEGEGEEGQAGTEGEDGGEGEGEEDPAGAEGDAPAGDEPSKAAVTGDDDVLKRLAAMIKGEAPPREEARQEAPPREAEAPVEIYTKEEKDLLAAYEKDWPDIAKAEQLRRKGEYNQLVAYVFEQIGGQLRPMMETLRTVSERAHLMDLQSTVEDYPVVRDKVVEWVDTQPEYLQAAYKHVIERGTVDEVADLIDRYKRETGAAAKPAAPPPKKKTETELPSATKQAAASMAPVSSKRSVVPGESDPEDFEGAFAKFAEKL